LQNSNFARTKEFDALWVTGHWPRNFVHSGYLRCRFGSSFDGDSGGGSGGASVVPAMWINSNAVRAAARRARARAWSACHEQKESPSPLASQTTPRTVTQAV